MLVSLARVRLAARDPAEAALRYAALLGHPDEPGAGAPASRGAQRFRLENVELAIEEASEPAASASGARGGEGLAGLVFGTADLEAAQEAARAGELAPRPGGGAPPALELDVAATRGVPLRLEEAPERAAPAAAPPRSDAVRALDHVVIQTSDAEAARRLYGGALGLRLALDRSFPEWGVRLLFFRVGGVTVELAASLREAPAAERPDRLWGLSWRVADVDAARERLAGAGLDVSAVRAGRKPGTRVFSVRDGTCGVPTLVIGPEPA